MSSASRRSAERRLRAYRAPLESQSGERAWPVVRAVYADRPAIVPRRRRRRLALVPALAILAGVLVLTPAGAAVHRWIERTLGVKHAQRALFSLPAPGQILVAGSGGSWTVQADGSNRRLDAARDATWSPHGRYVAVATGDQLVAVNRRGIPQWSIARPDVRLPRWFGPDGYRLAYLSGPSLRVIAGDGTGDRRLADPVAPIAPAWRPGHMYELAYARPDRTVVVRDADTGRTAWTRRLRGTARLVSWSSGGDRLLVLTRSSATVFDGSGRQLTQVGSAPGSRDVGGALSPDGRELAVLDNREVTLHHVGETGGSSLRAFSGAGLAQIAFSPDGRWLLVSWPAADQWVFIRVAGRPRILAVSGIAEQFGARRAFPTIEGWCCTAASGGS